MGVVCRSCVVVPLHLRGKLINPTGLHAGSSEPQIITLQVSPKSDIFRPFLVIFLSAFQLLLFIVAHL